MLACMHMQSMGGSAPMAGCQCTLNDMTQRSVQTCIDRGHADFDKHIFLLDINVCCCFLGMIPFPIVRFPGGWHEFKSSSMLLVDTGKEHNQLTPLPNQQKSCIYWVRGSACPHESVPSGAVGTRQSAINLEAQEFS